MNLHTIKSLFKTGRQSQQIQTTNDDDVLMNKVIIKKKPLIRPIMTNMIKYDCNMLSDCGKYIFFNILEHGDHLHYCTNEYSESEEREPS